MGMLLNLTSPQLLEKLKPYLSKVAAQGSLRNSMDGIGDSADKITKNLSKMNGKLIDNNVKENKESLSGINNKLDAMEKDQTTMAKGTPSSVGANKGDSRINTSSNLAENSPVTSNLSNADNEATVNQNRTKGAISVGGKFGPSGTPVMVPKPTGRNVTASLVDQVIKEAAISAIDGVVYKRKVEKSIRPKKTKGGRIDRRYLTTKLKRTLK